MSQITLYRGDATQALVDLAALTNCMSKSRWEAEIIRKHAAQKWPQDCLELAGRFADFPLREAEEVSGNAHLPARYADRRHGVALSGYAGHTDRA